MHLENSQKPLKSLQQPIPFILSNYLNEQQLSKKVTCLPLQFQYLPVEILSKQFTKLNNPHQYRIHYLGPRYKNTLQLHKKNGHSEKKPFVYKSELFGDYLQAKTRKLQTIRQIILKSNEERKCQESEAHGSEKQQTIDLPEQSVSQIGISSQNAKERYKVDIRKIVHSYLLEQKLKNTQFFKSSVFYRAFQGMNPSLNLSDQYIFNSCFQNGNLDCVIKLDERQFDLFLRIDSNTRGHLLWFYFSVQNQNKLGKIRMNICNFSKSKTLYKDGLRPYIFSTVKHKTQGKGWQQNGVNLGLQKQELRYEILQNKYNGNSTHCLVLQYDFQHQNDQVFFAYCIPYTYSQLLNDIDKLPEKYVEKATLGKSLLGTNIPILHITEHANVEFSKGFHEEAQSTTTNLNSDYEINKINDQSTSKKRLIFCTGRIHPSESNSSYVIMGFIKWLCSDEKQAVELRKIARFVIVPMVNPDGVIIGNSRTSASGKDLNRQYINPDPSLHPQICLIKQLAKKIHDQHEITLFLDFHGHSRKKNTFFYGPVYNISEPNYTKCRILPKLIQKISNPFRYHSCSFSIIEEKKKTARASMFQNLGISYTYTVESSIGYFYDSEKLKIFEFSQTQWVKMGSAIAQGTSLFITGIDQYEQILTQKRKERLKKKKIYRYPNSKVQYLEDNIFLQIDTGQQPLKIGYQDKDSSISPKNQKGMRKNIFLQLLEEIRSTTQKQRSPQKMPERGKQVDLKELDVMEDSDSHDDNEDMEMKRLNEFKFLVKQAAKNESSGGRERHNYEIKFNVTNDRKSKQHLKQAKVQQNKVVSQFQLLKSVQRSRKAPMRSSKTGDGKRNVLIENQLQAKPSENQFHKQKTLPEQLNSQMPLTNDDISNNFQTPFSKHVPKRPIYTSIKREKRNDTIQKRQKTIGNYFGEYRLMITMNNVENEKKKEKYDIIRKLQSRREQSRKKRAESSNQIKNNFDLKNHFDLNNHIIQANTSTLVSKYDKVHPEIIHRPTEFTFSLPFAEMAENSKSFILKPKLKVHLKPQKPHSLQMGEEQFNSKQRDSSASIKEKSQKFIQGFYGQAPKESAREKKVSQSYLIQHGGGKFFNKAVNHTSEKNTGRMSNRCTKIDLKEVRNTSLVNNMKIFQM